MIFTNHFVPIQFKFLSIVLYFEISYNIFIEETMMDVMFEIPSQEDVKLVRITKEAVDGTEKPILETA